ncbi:MAG: signal recognition particle-docking protein FtsY [Streptosporangiaceae bacterium]
MEYVALAIALGVLAFVVAVGLVTRAATKSRHTPPPQQTEQTVEPTEASRDTAADTTAVVSPPPTGEPETAATAEPAPEEAERPAEVESPAPAAGRLVRLRARLARSQNAVGRGLLSILARETLDEEAWEEVEDLLLGADVGVSATEEIVEDLRKRVRVLGTRGPDELRGLLREAMLAEIGTDVDRSLQTLPHDDRPAVVLVCGVNGTGKTTTCGKLARVLVADGRSVLLGAADTFRAAAVDQLETWGTRVGARTVRGPEAADPASVAFDAVREGVEERVDTVIVDTAGRLHTKAGLMDELGKVKRVVERRGPVDEVLLVLDATTGQNGLAQARVFSEVVDVSGLVLTKLDGTAKGGIVISVQRELGVPVKLVGLGEGADDLAPFESDAFVDALLGEESG